MVAEARVRRLIRALAIFELRQVKENGQLLR